MSDQYTETTSTGWLSRIMASIKGVAIGALLILVAIVALFWNEGRSIHRSKALAEGLGAVVEGSIDKVDPANEGKLLYLTGQAEAAGTLLDADFNVDAPHALRLARVVEMYQWEEDEKTETRKKLGGGEEKVKTYTYTKVWTDRVLDSSKYHGPGHVNPGRMSVPAHVWNAADATIGAFHVNDVILEQLAPTTVIKPTGAMPALAATMPTSMPAPSTRERASRVSDDMIYLGDPASPAIGDVRVRFNAVPAGPISLVARQVGQTFEPYAARTGEVLLVEPGTVSNELMFKHAADANRLMTWAIRGIGFVVIGIGFGMIFAPLKVVADVVPFIGSLVGAGTFIAALVCAVPVWCVTVGIAWLFYRPLWGIALLVIAVVVPIAIIKMRKPKRPLGTVAMG